MCCIQLFGVLFVVFEALDGDVLAIHLAPQIERELGKLKLGTLMLVGVPAGAKKGYRADDGGASGCDIGEAHCYFLTGGSSDLPVGSKTSKILSITSAPVPW